MKCRVLVMCTLASIVSACGGGGGSGGSSTPLGPPPSFSASTSAISLGQQTSLNWNANGNISCTGSGDWSMSSMNAVGSSNVTPTKIGTNTFTISCPGLASATVTVNVEPALYATSYQNAKANGFTQQNIATPMGATRAYGDFTNTGGVDLFIATQTYNPQAAIESATPATYDFWHKQSDGSFTKVSNLISSSVTPCLHPRKAIVADFNKDGQPDIFVACHGYDAGTFPGERSQVILSQPDGKYSVKYASTDVGFFHGASAGDLNGDGYPDVILANIQDGNSVTVLINKGDGTFQRETTQRLPNIGAKPYFTVEFVDINEDGKPDVFLGGHEFEGAPTIVILNPGDNNFTAAQAIQLPAVPNEGVVLDVVLTGTGPTRSLWINRSSGGDGTFYKGITVQKIVWQGLVSTVALENRNVTWTPWLIPIKQNGQNYIVSDDQNVTLQLPF